MKQSQGTDPYLDDYYHLHYSHRCAIMHERTAGGPPAGPGPTPTDATLASFPLLNGNREYKPPVEADGALGSIRTSVSPRAPKAMIASVAQAGPALGDPSTSERAVKRATLLAIERAYRQLLEMVGWGWMCSGCWELDTQ